MAPIVHSALSSNSKTNAVPAAITPASLSTTTSPPLTPPSGPIKSAITVDQMLDDEDNGDGMGLPPIANMPLPTLGETDESIWETTPEIRAVYINEFKDADTGIVAIKLY